MPPPLLPSPATPAQSVGSSVELREALRVRSPLSRTFFLTNDADDYILHADGASDLFSDICSAGNGEYLTLQGAVADALPRLLLNVTGSRATIPACTIRAVGLMVRVLDAGRRDGSGDLSISSGGTLVLSRGATLVADMRVRKRSHVNNEGSVACRCEYAETHACPPPAVTGTRARPHRASIPIRHIHCQRHRGPLLAA